MGYRERLDRAYAERVDRLSSTRHEIESSKVKQCRSCGVPVAWFQSPSGHWLLCLVYEQPDGRLLLNTEHRHFSTACEARVEWQKQLREAGVGRD